MKYRFYGSTLAGKSVLNLAANGSRILLSFLATVFASRWLGPDDFGHFNLIFSYTSFLNFMLTLGFEHTFSYYLPRQDSADSRPAQGLLKAGLLASAAIGLVVVSLTVLLFQNARLRESPLFWASLILVIQTVIWAQGTIFAGYLRGLKEFFPLILKEQIVFPLLHVLILVIFVYILGRGLDGYALGYLLATLLASLIPFVTHWELFVRSLSNGVVNAEESWKWIRFSLPLALMNVLEPLMAAINIILMGFFFPAAEVGIFSLCVRLAIFAQLAVVAFGPIVAPYFSEESHRQSRPGTLYQRVSNWTVRWTLFFVFAFLTAPEIIIHVFGTDYSEAIPLIGLVLIGPAFEGAFGLTKVALAMSGFNRINAVLMGAGLLIQTSGALILMPKLGVSGAAIAFSLGFVFVNCARLVYYHSKTGVWPLKASEVLQNLLLLAFFGSAGFLLNYMAVDLPARLLSIAVLSVVFLVFSVKKEILKPS